MIFRTLAHYSTLIIQEDMDGKSLSPQEIKLQELKAILPEVFTENKVDWEKLKATLGEDINDGELILMLEKATTEIVDAIVADHPKKVIALDILFQGNDQLKTNTSLQMKDAGIEFKMI